MDSFVGKDDESDEDLSCENSKSRTQTADSNTTTEHHPCPVVSSEDLRHKKCETSDQVSLKNSKGFTGAKQKDVNFNIAGTRSNKAESSISSLPASVIRQTRDEPRRVFISPENEKATPELINEPEDDAQARSSLEIREHVAGPSHFVSDACDKRFFFKFELDTQHAVHSKEKSFSCHICKQKFSFKGNLEQHMLAHRERKAYECDRCLKDFKPKDYFARRYRIQTSEKPYICEKCGRSFVAKDDESDEIEDLSCGNSKSRTQTADWNTTAKHNPCPVVSSEELRHKRKCETSYPVSMKKSFVFTGTKQKDVNFEIAETRSDKTESGVSSLPVSVIRHTRDEPRRVFIPPENEKASPELINKPEDDVQAGSSLEIHEHVAGPSHFACDKCDRRFFTKNDLHRHGVVHIEMKSYSCRFCELKFFFECNLERHMLTHTERKPYECDSCPKAFKQKGCLVRHYRVHTGEKPYTCENCGRSFAYPSNLNRHHKRC